MDIVKRMDKDRFAEVLLNMNDNDVIHFATFYNGYEDENELETIQSDDVECWYFAKKIFIPEFSSRFVILDYAGGEEAFAIPLNGYSEKSDDDDRWLVPMEVERYFKMNRGLEGGNYVYVEMEGEE